MTYWAVVSSTQGLNKIEVYFYKFKEFSRRKSLIFPGVLQAHANQDTGLIHGLGSTKLDGKHCYTTHIFCMKLAADSLTIFLYTQVLCLEAIIVHHSWK